MNRNRNRSQIIKEIGGVLSKECTGVLGCNKWKPLSEFKVSRIAKSDGHITYSAACHACELRYDQTRHQLEYLATHSTLETTAAYKLKKQKIDAARPWRSMCVRAYQRGYPERKRAHDAIATALKNKSLIKTCCLICRATGSRNTMHHDSYEEKDWLVVKELCMHCHKLYHVAHPEITPEYITEWSIQQRIDKTNEWVPYLKPDGSEYRFSTRAKAAHVISGLTDDYSAKTGTYRITGIGPDGEHR